MLRAQDPGEERSLQDYNYNELLNALSQSEVATISAPDLVVFLISLP